MVDLLSTGNVIVKTPNQPHQCPEAVITWFLERGIPKAQVIKFLHISGCDSVRSAAAYLRMQLPPLERANQGAVVLEMQTLLGVSSIQARKVIQDADVLSVPFLTW